MRAAPQAGVRRAKTHRDCAPASPSGRHRRWALVRRPALPCPLEGAGVPAACRRRQGRGKDQASRTGRGPSDQEVAPAGEGRRAYDCAC
nr:unnamed protein product [Digitaria exilis]